MCWCSVTESASSSENIYAMMKTSMHAGMPAVRATSLLSMFTTLMWILLNLIVDSLLGWLCCVDVMLAYWVMKRNYLTSWVTHVARIELRGIYTRQWQCTNTPSLPRSCKFCKFNSFWFDYCVTVSEQLCERIEETESADHCKSWYKHIGKVY